MSIQQVIAEIKKEEHFGAYNTYFSQELTPADLKAITHELNKHVIKTVNFNTYSFVSLNPKTIQILFDSMQASVIQLNLSYTDIGNFSTEQLSALANAFKTYKKLEKLTLDHCDFSQIKIDDFKKLLDAIAKITPLKLDDVAAFSLTGVTFSDEQQNAIKELAESTITTSHTPRLHR